MPTTLTPQEQLDAANAQYKSLVNQQAALGNTLTLGQLNDIKISVVGSGNYPALEVATTAQPTQVPGQPLSVNVSNNFFVIPGDAPPDSIIITNNTGAGTVNLINTNLSNTEYVAALQATPNTGQGTQFDSALTAAYAAQKANEDAAATAQTSAIQPIITANQSNPNVVVPTPPSSSDAAIAAANNRDRQNGDIITQNNTATTTTANTTTAVQNDAATNENNNATASGDGSATNTNTTQPNAPTPSALYQIQNGNNQVINPNNFQNPNNGVADDAANGNGPTSPDTSGTPTTNNNGTDQISTANSDVPSRLGSASGTSLVTSSGPAAGGSTNQSKAGSGNGGNSPTSTDTSNKLHAFTNHTYKISIYAIPPSTVNMLADGSITPDNPTAILTNSVFVLSDGGRGATGGDKSYFPVDYGIDNLEIESVVSPTRITRGSDVITMKFDIIEPYTTNFLENCQKINQNFNPGTNASWDSLFFVMVIEFLGYDDFGRPQKIPNTTKYIPFTFLHMKFKIASSGTIYNCQAIPTNMLANSGIDNVIPFHVETQANTIKELFNAQDIAGYNKTTLRANSADQQTITQSITNGNTIGNTTTITKDLQDALNQNEIDKTKKANNGKPVNKGQYRPNKYIFNFDTRISSATIADPQAFSDKSVPSVGGDKVDASKAKQLKQGGAVGSLIADFTKKTFRAQAGTKITDFINSVIKVSSYMTNQISTSASDSKPINWWKINPTIKFGPLDEGTNFYQREITYNIVPYVIRGQDAPGLGQQQVQQSEIVKVYQYIYSGNNRDVLDMNIEYNMAFFEVKNGVSTRYTIQSGDNVAESSDSGVGVYNGYTDTRFFKPRYFHTTGIANQQNTSDTTAKESTIVIQDFMEKLFDNAGDLISLDITIVGDPDWISQDVPFYGPILPNGSYIGGGSVNFTNPVYFNFYFATPDTDYDDTSGLFNSSGKYSQFSGIYQVISVKSNFSGGKFTQRLTNVRVRNQEPPKSGTSRGDSVNNAAPTASNNAGNAPIAEPSTAGTVRPDAVRATISPTAAPPPVVSQPLPPTDAFNDLTGQIVPPNVVNAPRITQKLEDLGLGIGD